MIHSSGSSINSSHSLRSREIGKNNSLKSFEENRVINNIRTQNYKNIILNDHLENIRAFDVQGSYVVIAKIINLITMWNWETKKCLWVFQPQNDGKIIWEQSIKLLENKIVAGATLNISRLPGSSNFYEFKNRIYVIDRKTGIETALIKDWRIELNNICIIGRKIFAYLCDHQVAAWNLEGELLGCFKLQTLHHSISTLLAVGNHLVHIFERTVVIIDSESGAEKMLAVSNVPISSHYVDGSRLICGFTTLREEEGKECSPFDACIIDIEGGEITHRYKAKDAFLHSEINLSFEKIYLTESGKVSRIVCNREWLVLGHTTGKVVVVNLIENKHCLLYDHDYSIDYLVLKENLLITGICDRNFRDLQPQSELKYWDLKSLEEINEARMTSLRKISFIEGKLFAACGKSLVCTDYLI